MSSNHKGDTPQKKRAIHVHAHQACANLNPAGRFVGRLILGTACTSIAPRTGVGGLSGNTLTVCEGPLPMAKLPRDARVLGRDRSAARILSIFSSLKTRLTDGGFVSKQGCRFPMVCCIASSFPSTGKEESLFIAVMSCARTYVNSAYLCQSVTARTSVSTQQRIPLSVRNSAYLCQSAIARTTVSPRHRQCCMPPHRHV